MIQCDTIRYSFLRFSLNRSCHPSEAFVRQTQDCLDIYVCKPQTELQNGWRQRKESSFVWFLVGLYLFLQELQNEKFYAKFPLIATNALFPEIHFCLEEKAIITTKQTTIKALKFMLSSLSLN